MTNKERALAFFNLLFEQKVPEAYERFIAPGFIHHNQWFKGDRETLLQGMKEAHAQFPQSVIDVKHVFEDGAYVITHSHVKHTPEQEFAAVHIFRFENGKIVELWDSPVQIEKNSPNKNGPF